MKAKQAEYYDSYMADCETYCMQSSTLTTVKTTKKYIVVMYMLLVL